MKTVGGYVVSEEGKSGVWPRVCTTPEEVLEIVKERLELDCNVDEG